MSVILEEKRNEYLNKMVEIFGLNTEVELNRNKEHYNLLMDEYIEFHLNNELFSKHIVFPQFEIVLVRYNDCINLFTDYDASLEYKGLSDEVEIYNRMLSILDSFVSDTSHKRTLFGDVDVTTRKYSKRMESLLGLNYRRDMNRLIQEINRDKSGKKEVTIEVNGSPLVLDVTSQNGKITMSEQSSTVTYEVIMYDIDTFVSRFSSILYRLIKGVVSEVESIKLNLNGE